MAPAFVTHRAANCALEPFRDISRVGSEIICDPIKAADVFARLKAFKEQAFSTLDASIAEGEEAMKTAAPELRSRLKDDVQFLIDKRGNLGEQYATAVNTVHVALTEGVKRYGLALANDIKDLPADARVQILDNIREGTTDLARKVGDILATSPDGNPGLGVGVLTLAQRRKNSPEMIKSLQEQYQSRIQYGGNYSLGMSSKDLEAAYHRAPNVADRQKFTEQYISRLESERAIWEKELDKLSKNYNPLDEKSVADISKATDAVAQLTVKIEEAKLSINDLDKAFISFGASVGGAMQSSIGNALNSIITGTGTVRDVLRGFATDIVRSFSDITSKLLMSQMLQGLAGTSWGSGVAGWLGGGTTKAAANGAVFSGGFTPIHAFSSGGIVRSGSPVLGLIGEGKSDEAVVPLPSGGRIPVEFRGGGGGGERSVVYMIVPSAEEAFRRGARANRDVIVDIAAGSVRSGGKLGKVIRRG